jgi:hypothetical protein
MVATVAGLSAPAGPRGALAAVGAIATTAPSATPEATVAARLLLQALRMLLSFRRLVL